MKPTSTTVCLLLVLALVFAQEQQQQVPGKWFDQIILVVFENQPLTKTMDNAVFKNLTKQGILLDNYYGVTHPSQPNYLSLICGEYFGIHLDTLHNISSQSVVDLLERKLVSWRTYQEDFPSACYSATEQYPYARKHNPFISMDNIRNNATRCSNIVNANRFFDDAASNTLAQYNFYTPNLRNDGHDTGLAGASAFAGPFIEKLMPLIATSRTLVVLTFDEDNYLHFNHIYTVAMGPVIKAAQHGTSDNHKYNHYSTLRTVEENWNLGTLGKNDDSAQPFKFW